ncbi:MAG: aldolase, partial [Thermoguttaceae bacterium]|nr:aldolase [Thermoguttaceae bacterium]
EAAENIDEILTVPGIDEYYVGLNDLHLSYGLTFMFELLINGRVEELVKKFKAAGKPFGFGGIARINAGMLLANYILAEHYRLGSSSVILARAFCNSANATDFVELDEIFRNEVAKFRMYERFLERRDAAYFEDVRELLRAGVEEVKQAILKNAK